MKGLPQKKNCPVCGECLDIDTYVPGEETQEPIEPKAGDITFCFNCRTILVINQASNIVLPNEDELYDITHDPDFHHFIESIDNARRIKPNLN